MSTVQPPAPRSFSTTVLQTGDEVVVTAIGDLDGLAADTFDRELRRLALGGRRLVIDLRRVDFLDSSGLRALLALRNQAKRNHHDLTLIPGPPAVRRVFRLTATTGLFDWREE